MIATTIPDDGKTLVVPSENYPQLKEAICPRCFWSTAGSSAPDLAQNKAENHDAVCTGTAPEGITQARIAMGRARLAALGLLPAEGWERAAAYFRSVKPERIIPPGGERTWKAEFPPLGDDGRYQLVLVVSHWTGRGYRARLERQELMSYGTRLRPLDPDWNADLASWEPTSPKTGLPAAYSRKRLVGYAEQILADLTSAGDGPLLRKVPGQLVAAPEPERA